MVVRNLYYYSMLLFALNEFQALDFITVTAPITNAEENFHTLLFLDFEKRYGGENKGP